MSREVEYIDMLLCSYDFDFERLSDFRIKSERHFEVAEVTDAVLDFYFLFVDVEAEIFQCVAYHFACDRTEHFAVVFAAFRADFDGYVFKFVCKFFCLCTLGGYLCFICFLRCSAT